jgi:subtilisin family serine protease
LDFLAPGATEQTYDNGKGILSAIPGTKFRRYQGTSMAAPHVAGAFAILKSAVPAASLEQMRQALQKTGRMVADPRNGVTAPRIQLDAAIKILQATLARGQPKQPQEPPEPAPKQPRERQKPAPEVEAKEPVHDGIRVEDGRDRARDGGRDSSKDSGNGDGEKRIKW